METTTERCSLKIAVLNFQNIKKITYNFNKILSFPCTFCNKNIFTDILTLVCIPSYNCVTILISFQLKVENFRRGEGTFFGILEGGSVKWVTGDKISKSGGGTKSVADQHFLKKLEGGTYLGGQYDLEFSKLLS